jgi:16S rRNA (cytidine1402-2'-O)-methyltransferase
VTKAGSGLILVATPIGNAGDISLRALAALREADAIVCEDTRVTAKLMAAHGIERPLLAYHEHNAARMRPILIDRLRQGQTLALVSDAGTPLISDPGYKLVRAAIAEALPVTTIPGPSAPVAALILSGLPTDRFLFAGFLSHRAGARRAELSEVSAIGASLVFFESPARLARTLADMAEILGPRDAAVARELTKMFEEVRRGGLADLAAHYARTGPPKGEIVIVVAPPTALGQEVSDDSIDQALRQAMAGLSLRDAVDAVAETLGRPRRDVYRRALAIAGGQ